MAIVYIEARPKGRPEGTRIDDYVVEDHADHVLATFRTQQEGNRLGEKKSSCRDTSPRSTLNNKRSPDHWRTV